MKIISLCILVLLVTVITQTIEVEDKEEVQKDTIETNDQQGTDPKDMTPEQQIESTKNIFYSCIVVTRNYLSSGEGIAEGLQEIADVYADIENPAEQRTQQINVWKRIYIDHVKYCADHQSHEGAMEIYKALYGSTFDPKNHFGLVQDVNLSLYKNKGVVTIFNEQEEMLWNMMEEFEKKIKEANDKGQDKAAPKSGRERREEREQREGKEKPEKNEKRRDYSDFEPKMFGTSLKAGSRFMEILFLFGVFGIFFFVLFVGFKIVTKEDKPKDKKKVKKEKKQE